jgi:hypothetical protein
VLLVLSLAGLVGAGEEGVYCDGETGADGSEFGMDEGDGGLLRPGWSERVSGWRSMGQDGYGRVWTEGIGGEGSVVVFEQSAGVDELEVSGWEVEEGGDAGAQVSEGRVWRGAIEGEAGESQRGRGQSGDADLSRASLMTSRILL